MTAICDSGQTEDIEFISSDGNPISLKNPLFGAHNTRNILSAIAVGTYFEVEASWIKRAIEGYVPGENRSQWVESGDTRIMLDAYNANPTSMRLAIESIASMPEKRKILILGSMKELGPESDMEHQSLLEFLKSRGPWEKVILVGEEYQGAGDPSWHHFNDVQSAGAWLRHQEVKGSLLLIKGSRANALEKLLEVIQPFPS
jgi:UDP-N-acetylmuramoyl-tripeptide--D-alanyl-D-alanine ligase